MKIRGVIISTIMAVVVMTSCAMANEPDPVEVSSAAPVMVPYLNKSITEVKEYGHADATDGFTETDGQDRAEDGQDPDHSDDGQRTVLKNTGRMEVRESEAKEDGDSKEDPGSGSPDGSDPVLTYLGEWTITAYCPCSACCGVWATGCTASGEPATACHTIACNILPFYTQVMIDDVVYTVEDTGSTEYGDAWIDVFFNTHEEALAFGVQTKSVYLVN